MQRANEVIAANTSGLAKTEPRRGTAAGLKLHQTTGSLNSIDRVQALLRVTLAEILQLLHHSQGRFWNRY
jgi:hypothetical protein